MVVREGSGVKGEVTSLRVGRRNVSLAARRVREDARFVKTEETHVAQGRVVVPERASYVTAGMRNVSRQGWAVAVAGRGLQGGGRRV